MQDQASALGSLLSGISFWAMGDVDSAKYKGKIDGWKKESGDLLVAMKFTKTPMSVLDRLLARIKNGESAEDRDEDDFKALGTFLAKVDPQLESLTEIPISLVRIIRANAQFLRNGSDAAYKALYKNASKIDPAFGSEVIDQGVPSQLTDAHKLIDTIEELTGRRDIKLTELEKEQFRSSHKHEYQTILECRKRILAVAKQFLCSHARRKGGRVRYSELLEDFKDAYVFHDWPSAKNWDGFVDDNGVLYTEGGLEIKGKPGFPIEGNPQYDPETNDTFVFSCQTSMGNKQYFYTVEAVTGWRKERFEAVELFAPIIDKVRRGWLADIKKDGKVQKLGVLCEILYWASARIGGEKNNVRGEKTFGISTLRGRHIEPQGQGVVIKYVGKTGVHQKHLLVPKTPEQRLTLQLLLEWKEEAGDDGAIFDLKGNWAIPPSNSTVNTYFRSKGAPDSVSVHKLRHARATVIMERQIYDPKVCPFFRKSGGELVLNKVKAPTQKEAEDAYKEMAAQVGAELGHTAGEKVSWSTAVQAYINPTTTTGFFDRLKLRIPSWAAKFADKD